MTSPKFLDQDDVRSALTFSDLIEALRHQFRVGAEVPLRHQHPIALDDEPEAILLLMPVWDTAGFGGVKLVNVHPGNNVRGIPALSASYLLFDSKTGQHLAFLDGGELTARRTAAASALAADYLCKKDAQSILLVGAGRVASNLAYAYKAVRNIEKVLVWDINLGFAEKLKADLRANGFDAEIASNLEKAVSQVDIVSCATLAEDPLIKGKWLKPGQHLDLIGGFTPAMREADDDAVSAATVFVDTVAVLAEAGDIIHPLENGTLSKSMIAGDLFSLCSAQHPGRKTQDEITYFKAVGTALEDLAAATLAFSKSSKRI